MGVPSAQDRVVTGPPVFAAALSVLIPDMLRPAQAVSGAAPRTGARGVFLLCGDVRHVAPDQRLALVTRNGVRTWMFGEATWTDVR
jgi:hypothetical protein